MAQKCVHKGCGKVFTDENDDCVYHPGPPVFHEGQKGWKCCKPRVLTFDEFLTIPPCTTGKHSTVDDTPMEPPKPAAEVPPTPEPAISAPIPRLPTKAPATAQPRAAQSPAPPVETEDDEPGLQIAEGKECRRRGCNNKYDSSIGRSDDENCVHHPGHPIFHEGSKGWTCCKKRVLDFNDFLGIEGCKTRSRHLFVGSGGKKKGDGGGEEVLESVRHDFYQTSSTVIASFFLKKIDKENSSISFPDSSTVRLDLITSDKKRFKKDVALYASIDTGKSSFKILGTKLELNLVKADGTGWPVLRAEDPLTGEIIQAGGAGRA
ncbi:CORD and CS domain protein [Patellaria atrata CBS 101060]|uniref:CORD and CS domain protein n=1 Tax=Patellaria atrata CBS 101060 TaxID=1346257 RepID=A0A9P4SHD0_9PEZI|nr:CORD and CS domain protein [Patellaria atrata CBS 101060]